ncbi:hypothetical protein ACH5RR_008327 [Cinchona calisaya]|uniref:NAC domain-containing protein n=1 Tax=Cinchona calisaya TaxID=153742 RepID=A0ABD3AEW9_9GENT
MSVSEAELQCKKDKLCNFQELLLDWKKFVPIGYKFNPTEHELLKYYLLAKVYGEHTLPGMDTGMGIFREVDVYQSHPAYLPGLDKEEEFCYFFTTRDTKNENGDRAERTTKDGRGNWRMTSKVNQICDVDNSILGRKNSLVYHLTNPSGGISSSKDYKTNWIMHEYVLDKSLYDPTKVPSTSGNTKPKQLVLCRIYERTKGAQTAPAEEVEKSQIARSSRSIQIRDTDDNSKRETPKKRKRRRPMTTPEEATYKSSCKNRPKRAKTVDEVDMNDDNTSLNDDSTSSSDQASRESQITLHPQEKPSLSRLVKLTEDEKRVVVFSENRKNPTEKCCDKEEQDESQMINGHVIEDGNDGSRKLLLADAKKNEQNSSEIDRIEEGSQEGDNDQH